MRITQYNNKTFYPAMQASHLTICTTDSCLSWYWTHRDLAVLSLGMKLCTGLGGGERIMMTGHGSNLSPPSNIGPDCQCPSWWPVDWELYPNIPTTSAHLPALSHKLSSSGHHDLLTGSNHREGRISIRPYWSQQMVSSTFHSLHKGKKSWQLS